MAARDRAKLRQVVDDLVVVQGNEFVKELLRSKKLRIGATKADFETSLHGAIESGELTTADVEIWLAEVEGWGAHHAYLFTLDVKRVTRLLGDPKRLNIGLERGGLVQTYDKGRPFAFPVRLTPTAVNRSDTGLEVVWHQGTYGWQRDRTQDFEEERDGDQYRFDAFRHRADRSVVRFVARTDLGLGGAFVPIPLGDEHTSARETAMQAANDILGSDALVPVNVGAAQLRLDHTEPTGQRAVAVSRSRMRAPGAYVEFGAVAPDGDFNDVEDVRQVRLAARDTLSGDSGDFTFRVGGETPQGRSVRVSLNANDRRIYIRAQLNAAEEWGILRQIAEA